MANEVDTLPEVYDLVKRSKSIKDILAKIPQDSPEIPELQSELKSIGSTLENIKPGMGQAVMHGFAEGTFVGQEGRLAGGLGKLLGDADYDSMVDANKIMREAAQKENPKTYGISQYVLPMINPYDPLSKLTNVGVKGVNLIKNKLLYEGVEKGVGKVAEPVIEIAADKFKPLFQGESHLIKEGLEKGLSKEAKEAARKAAIGESMLRGGIQSGIVATGNVDFDKPLAEQAVGVVLQTGMGAALGKVIPEALRYAGKGIVGLGDMVNNKFGEVFSRLPNNMVKKSVANLFKLSNEELKNMPEHEINWLKQYIHSVNSRGTEVIGGNRAGLAKLTDKMAAELTERNDNLINLSVDEGKSISVDALKNGIKSQFKGKDEKALVENTFKNFLESFQPPITAKQKFPSALHPEDIIPGEPKYMAEDLRATAKELQSFRNHLAGYIREFWKYGDKMDSSEARLKRVYEKIIDGTGFAYKHLEPEISKQKGGLLAKNAATIRGLINLRDQLVKSMTNEEAKKIAGSLTKEYAVPGALGYGFGIATGAEDPWKYALGAAALKKGYKSVKGLAGLTDRARYNLGVGLSGDVPVMMGGSGARPLAATIDMYKTAGQASPPEPPPMEIPEEEPVEDFTGFGSSSEWIRSQMGK